MLTPRLRGRCRKPPFELRAPPAVLAARCLALARRHAALRGAHHAASGARGAAKDDIRTARKRDISAPVPLEQGDATRRNADGRYRR